LKEIRDKVNHNKAYAKQMSQQAHPPAMQSHPPPVSNGPYPDPPPYPHQLLDRTDLHSEIEEGDTVTSLLGFFFSLVLSSIMVAEL